MDLRPALVAGLLLLAGCTASTPADTPSPTPTATPTGTPTSPASPSADCVDDVSFWGLDGSASTWAPDRVRVGYTLPASSSALFVVQENDTVLGWIHAENGDPNNAIASDGDPIELDAALEGTHTLRVVVYRDVDGNGAFDADADEPCEVDGAVVQAGPRAIDFDRFSGNGTATG